MTWLKKDLSFNQTIHSFKGFYQAAFLCLVEINYKLYEVYKNGK